MAIDFLASLMFFLIPYFLGSFFTDKKLFAFVYGSLFWYFIFLTGGFVLSKTAGLSFIDFVSFSAVFVLSLFFAKIIFNLITKGIDIKIIKWKSLLKYLLILIYSFLVYFLIWKKNTPYPLQLNWDVYEHITLANNLLAGKVSFLPSYSSDTFTFDGYSTIFHSLLSIPLAMFRNNLLGVYWWLEFWNFVLTITASVKLTEKLTKNKLAYFFAAFLSGLIFESSIVYSNLFLIPQSFSTVLLIFLLSEILEKKDFNQSLQLTKGISRIKVFISKHKAILLSFLFIILCHFVIGIFGTIIGMILLFFTKNSDQKYINWFLKISGFTFFLSLVAHFFGSFAITSREEAIHFNLSLQKVVGLIKDWYGIGSFFLFLLGVIKLLKSQIKNNQMVVGFAFLTCAVAFAPFSYFLKFFVIARYFVNFVLVVGLVYLLTRFSGILKYLIILFTLTIFLSVFYFNQASYKEQLFYSDHVSHISENELDAANWLIRNYKNNSFIISDPSTQYILEAATGINSQGGAYMGDETRRSLIRIDGNTNPVDVKNNLYSIQDKIISENGQIKHRLFIAGGRYFQWQRLRENEKMSFYYNIWSPTKIGLYDQQYINFLSQNFKLIYKNQEVIIFEI